MAYLYVIGTPIGNLEDITLRALRILKEVDCILCEDTRVTARLLEKYDIHTKTVSYHTKSTLSKEEFIFSMLEEGKKIALVSDAGTPAISDPGVRLVARIKEKFTQEEVKVVAIPGPSALVSALSISGVSAAEFTFLGFLPHKKGRETLFKEISESKRTTVFYESPHRIEKTLESLRASLEGKSATIVIARELTKIYEETISGTPEEVYTFFKNNPEKIRGEFVVIVTKK